MKHIARILALSSVVAGTTFTTTAQFLADSLIAHFPLDGGANDIVGMLNPTDTVGSPGFCDDRFGTPNGAACFDGASFWSYGDTLDMDTTDFSVSFWFKTDAPLIPGQTARLVNKGGTVYGTPENSGWGTMFQGMVGGLQTIECFTGDASVHLDTVEAAFTPVSWTHVVFMRCDTQLFEYLDGALVDQQATLPDRNVNSDIHFAFGALVRLPTDEPHGGYFTGALDDVRIYKGRCLSQAEIDTLYYGLSVGLNEQGTVAPVLQMFPNPVKDVLTIRADPNWEGPIRTMILDAAGRVVRTPERSLLVGLGGLEAFMIPLEGIAPGVYFVQVKGPDWEAHGKFIKE